METTLGMLLTNEALPSDMRNYRRQPLDKKNLKELLRELYDKHPDQYRDVVHRLMRIGQSVATSSGISVSLNDLRSSQAKHEVADRLRRQIAVISARDDLDDEVRHQKIVELLSSALPALRDRTHQEGLDTGNSFSRQVLSGARGNPANLNSLRGADLVVLDHKDRPTPMAILHNYSEGLDPAEYWASAPGSRKGVVVEKRGTAEAGYLAKQLINAASDLLVTDEEPLPNTGFPVDTDDPDNEGSVLARNYGDFDAGTVLTPSIQKALNKKHKRILVHSPISAGGRGVPRIAAGYRERGGFSPIGDNIGVAAAQAATEPLTQSLLSTKHGAGVVGADFSTSASGFKGIEQLFNVPGTFIGAATLAQLDGKVEEIEDAPQGGQYVTVGGQQHYVSPQAKVEVNVGDVVEAGDSLTNGVPNPAEIVKFKHVGEGRRYFVQQLRKTLKDEGINIHRRNLELVARAIINHVRVTDPDGLEDALPDDIVPYDRIAQGYQQRYGTKNLPIGMSRGKYLEEPVLHYSIGTRVTPRVVDNLKEFGVSQVRVHDDEPSFAPHMVRAVMSSAHHPDVFRRLGGFHIQKGFFDAVHRGKGTDVHGPSWQHGLAEGVGFGQKLETEGVY